MIVLTASNISKSYGATPVLSGITFSAGDNARMGFVGVNGAGKTTLFNIIAGEDAADDGRVSVQSPCTIGYLKQNNEDVSGLTVLGTLERALMPVVEMELRLREMECEMASAHEDGAAFRKLGIEYDELLLRYEDSGGYDRESRIQGVLAGLGFTREQQEQRADTLSGGERTRLKLAELLLRRPDILLLDEPTNHLDLESTQWLEEMLKSYNGAVLVISHDRYLLDAVCTQIAELSRTKLRVYDGNYTLYARKAAKAREEHEKAYALQQREISRQEDIIARYRMYNTEQSIKKAESREKMLARIERIEKPRAEESFSLSFKAGRESGRDVLMAENISKDFGKGPLFQGTDLLVRSGERVALIGPNGSGKTTLINVLAGKLEPDTGFVRKGSGVDLGFFDQQHAELDPANRVIDELWNAFPRMSESQVRGALGALLFRGDDVFQRISTLSGGERARLTLLKLMLRSHNLLIMDEPTNHLDMVSRELLEKALDGFGGTLIAISHDRYFINRVASRVLVFMGGALEDYPGNYDAYLLSRRKPLEDEGPAVNKTRLLKDKRREKERREIEKRRKLEITEAEAEIARMEERQRELEALMSSPGFYSSPDAGALAVEYSRLPGLIEALYERWASLESGEEN